MFNPDPVDAAAGNGSLEDIPCHLPPHPSELGPGFRLLDLLLQCAVLDPEVGRRGGCERAEAGSEEAVCLRLGEARGAGGGEGGVRGCERGM